MDGNFVEKINEPYDEMKDLELNKKLDVHLMVSEPESYILKYKELNTEYITIHDEIDKDKFELLEVIKSYGIKCGIAINPATPVENLEKYLNVVDLILIMSVVPGKGGQSFIEESTKKVDKVREMVNKTGRDILINVDGGIKDNTIDKVRNADMVVSGSYVLNGNYEERIRSLM